MPPPSFDDAAARLAWIGRSFHARGWAPATSGNYSAVLGRDPLRLAISASGIDKSAMTAGDVVVVDANGTPEAGHARPSDEAAVHLAVVRQRGAGAVLHTHSVWATLLSDGAAGEVVLEGFELLKGLAGVKTHDHVERVPVVDNQQDYVRLAESVAAALSAHPSCHGLLMRGHGLYAWGSDVEEARRHVEALEFLFEVVGRRGGRS